MTAVGIAALILGLIARAELGRRLAKRYQSDAMGHRVRAWFEEGLQAPGKSPGYYVPIPKPSLAEIEASKRRAANHVKMAEKCAWSALSPWLPLWPDPPEPE